MAASCSGIVKTTWKYSTGNSSAFLALKRMLEPLVPRQRLAFRAMAIPARVVGDARKFTLAALFDVAAQSCCPAGLNGLHQFELMQGKIVSLAVGGAGPEGTPPKNVGQLESWPWHRWLRFRPALRLRQVIAFQPVQRTHCGGNQLRRNPGVASRGVDPAMAKENLNYAHVRAVLQ
jgi:hypothetical protein